MLAWDVAYSLEFWEKSSELIRNAHEASLYCIIRRRPQKSTVMQASFLFKPLLQK